MFADHFDVPGEAEEFHGFKTASIHLLRDRQHGAGFHAERPQAQLAITQRGIDKANLIHDVGIFPAKAQRKVYS